MASFDEETYVHGVYAQVGGGPVVRGTHEFHIVGCSGRKRFASVGVTSFTSIKSGSFLAGGHTWALACGFDHEGHLASITLELLGIGAKDVVATAGIRIEDPLGDWPPAVWRSQDARRFQANMTWELSVPDAYHGHESRYVRDDRLTIQCTIDVLEEYSLEAAVETRNCFVSVVPPPTIAQDLHKLLLADESDYEERRRCRMEPDVTFVVEETEIQAHKLVLAMRSLVFAAEFRWHTNGTRLSIDDMSASTFRAMLRFIYTDELPIKASNTAAQPQRACKEKYASKRCGSMARNLLVAADRYDLERLRLMCHNILAESIDTSTVMGTLLLVRGRHSCRQLEDSCIEYIASQPEVYAAVMATEECQELKKSCSPLIIEIMERVATHNHNRNRNGAFESSSTGRLLEKSWSMYSASEEVGNYDWVLEVCPSEERQGNISMYLGLLSYPPADGVKVTKNYYMVYDPIGKVPVNVIKDAVVPSTYTQKDEAWGYDNFITFESAKSKYLAHDGSLTIYADIAVTKEQPYTSTSIPTTGGTIIVPSSSIALQLQQLMVSEQGADVRFLVEGSEIRAHGLVIAARSPILFEAVAAARDNNDGLLVVCINGMKATVFKAVLHFVYTDELPTLGNTVVAEDVLAAACRFFCCHNMFHRWSDIAKDVVAVAVIGMEDPRVLW
ncbi:hypothetical protein ACQ4PT_048163 [Festuca glaucescens]